MSDSKVNVNVRLEGQRNCSSKNPGNSSGKKSGKNLSQNSRNNRGKNPVKNQGKKNQGKNSNHGKNPSVQINSTTQIVTLVINNN